MNRTIGWLTFLLMLVANALLFVKDVLPRLSTAPPPRPRELALSPGAEQQTQQILQNDQGQTIGTIWTVATRSIELLTVRSWAVLEPMALAPGVRLPRIQIVSDVMFDKGNQLSEVNFRVFGLDVPVWFKGEFAPPGDFPFQWQLDDRRGTVNLPVETALGLRDALQPLGTMTGLEVGQSWSVHLVNPIASLAPGMDGQLQSTDMLVRVVRRETLRHGGEDVPVFVVEAEAVTAFVAEDGRLLKQVLQIPLLGRITSLDVPYDDALRRASISDLRKN